MGGEKKRSVLVLHPTSLASIESLSLPLVQEIVISADMKCSECQKRISEIMSRLSVTESVVVNSLEKKVIVTCRRSYANFDIVPLNKMALLRRVFRWTT